MHYHPPATTTRLRPLIQDMNLYTQEDRNVWQLLVERQMSRLPRLASADFLRGLDTLGFSAGRIPVFAEMNEKLNQYTGWQLKVVSCLCPVAEFFTLLANKTFTATCWLRRMNELDYLEEPDMFHDVFGHAPLLSNPAYTRFFEALGQLGQKYGHVPAALEMMERLYWFTIEFGLIHEEGQVRMYGAGVLSSVGETNHVLSEKSRKTSFELDTVIRTPFRTDVLQQQYFIIDGFDQLLHSLEPLEERLAETDPEGNKQYFQV